MELAPAPKEKGRLSEPPFVIIAGPDLPGPRSAPALELPEQGRGRVQVAGPVLVPAPELPTAELRPAV